LHLQVTAIFLVTFLIVMCFLLSTVSEDTGSNPEQPFGVH
jgi:hypothetical protein